MQTKLRKYLSLVLCVLMLVGSSVFPVSINAQGQVATPILSPAGWHIYYSTGCKHNM